MRKLLLCAMLFFSFAVCAPGAEDAVRPAVKALCTFRIQDAVELRLQKQTDSPVSYTALPHEGGVKVMVLEVLGPGSDCGKGGQWLWVLLTAPLWTQDGTYLAKGGRFLIFLSDGTPVLDFEE